MRFVWLGVFTGCLGFWGISNAAVQRVAGLSSMLNQSWSGESFSTRIKGLDSQISQEQSIYQLGPRIVGGFKPWNLRTQLYLGALNDGHAIVSYNQVFYSFNKRLVARCEFPLWWDLRVLSDATSGLGETAFGFDWIFYLTDVFAAKITIAAKAPTGPVRNIASLGDGAWEPMFMGTTVFQSDNWYVGSAVRASIAMWHKGQLDNTQVQYEFDFAHRFRCGPDRRNSFLLGFELNGFYNRPKRVALGKVNPNSGGNLILLGPLFGYKRGEIYGQINVDVPVGRNIWGRQPAQVEFVFRFSVEVRT